MGLTAHSLSTMEQGMPNREANGRFKTSKTVEGFLLQNAYIYQSPRADRITL